MDSEYSRHKSREIAIQTLYQIDMNEEGLEKNLKMLEDRLEDSDLKATFLENIITATYQNLDVIDKKLNENSEGWSVSRMGKIDRNILRLAVYEILYRDDIPIGVSIDEAVELAKTFAAERSSGFINAVLSKVVSTEEE
jgi:N utilization substance protein B